MEFGVWILSIVLSDTCNNNVSPSVVKLPLTKSYIEARFTAATCSGLSKSWPSFRNCSPLTHRNMREYGSNSKNTEVTL